MHSPFHLLSGSTGGQVEGGIEGVELEEVAVRLARGRARAAIANAAKIISALMAAATRVAGVGNIFRQLARAGGQVIDDPVGKGAGRSVRIVNDEGKTPGALRRAAPGKSWRNILAAAGVLAGNLATLERPWFPGQSSWHAS